MVKWDAGEITLGQYLKYIKVINRLDYKKVDEPALRKSLSEMAMNEQLFGKSLKNKKFRYDKRMLEIAMAAERRTLLPPVYVEEEITKKTVVTEEEVRRGVGTFTPKYVLRVFVHPELEKAELALSLLGKGEKFEDVVREHSEGFTKDSGGYFGEIEAARMRPFSEEQFEKITRLEEGAHSEIFELPIGHAIVYMENSRTPEKQLAEAVERFRDAVKLEVEKKKYREKVEALGKKASVKWNVKVRKEFARLLEGQGTGEIPPKLQRQVLVRVNGKPIYVGEAVLRMGGVHNPGDLDSFLDKRIYDEIVMQEAARLGLDRRIAVEMELSRKNWLARRYVEFLGGPGDRVIPEDLRKYYDENPSKFAVPEKRALQVIQFPDRLVGEKVQAAFREGRDFDRLAEEFNANPEASKAKGYTGYVEAANLTTDVREAVFALEKGGISGILPAKGKGGGMVYVIVRVLDIRPASVTPFERIDRRLVESRIKANRVESAVQEAFGRNPALEWREEAIQKIVAGG